MQIWRKIFLCSILMVIKVFATEPISLESYDASDLRFSSFQSGVIFFNNSKNERVIDVNGRVTHKGYYDTAVAYSNKYKDINGLKLKKFKDGPLHYLCLDSEERYNNLYQELEILNAALLKQNAQATHSAVLLTPPQCRQSSLEELVSCLQNSQTVVITFGAGISQGYVPTLLEFFNTLSIKKVASEDKATDDSMEKYISQLFSEKEKTLELTRREWLKVFSCDYKTTPAHTALKSLIEFLKEKGKDVFVYTDNIDGIHHRSEIELSEMSIPEEEMTEIKYPPIDKIAEKQVAVLVCGQSFDFHSILSTIQTRGGSAHAVSFFSLNVNANSIGTYEGLDVDKFKMIEKHDLCFPIKYLDMQYIHGSLHDTLPYLLDMMH
jgi:hypothetical protein